MDKTGTEVTGERLKWKCSSEAKKSGSDGGKRSLGGRQQMFGSQMLTAANVRRPFVGTFST